MHAILLGSGLQSFLHFFKIKDSLPYEKVLSFPFDDLEGHDRCIYLASYQEQDLLILSGKFHLYEGLSKKQIIAPLEFAIDNYPIDSFIITAASGGLSKEATIGEWQYVKSIISIPMVEGFTPLNSLFDSQKNTAFNSLPAATYAYHQGPSLGTPAEYKMLHHLEADLVGMSLLPEQNFLFDKNIKTHYLSLPVCNYFPFENIKEPTHQSVIEVADKGVLKLVSIFQHYLNNYKKSFDKLAGRRR